MKLVWSLGLEELQRKGGWEGGKRGTNSFSFFFLVGVFLLFFFSFSPLILWEWGGLSSFLFGLPRRCPSFACSWMGLFPISWHCSHCRCGQDCRDPSVPVLILVLSSHRQQMFWFLGEYVILCWLLLVSTAKWRYFAILFNLPHLSTLREWRRISCRGDLDGLPQFYIS